MQKNVLIIVAGLAATVVVLGLNYNYHLIVRSHYQKTLKKALKKLPILNRNAPYILLKMTDLKNEDLNTIPIWIPNYGATMLGRYDVSLRTFTSKPDPNSFWVVKFAADEKGVINAGPLGYEPAVPYNNLWILFFDGKKLWMPEVISKEDLVGLQIEWQRTTPIYQTMQRKLT